MAGRHHMAGKVFINDRRAESLKDARHLASLLDRGTLKGRIFIDLKGLDGAEDWLTELERQVAASDIVVSLICPDWTEIRDTTGKRRIDDDNDFVRFELAEAFRRRIPVVPVLVDGARMPRGEQLPPNLLLLTRPQAEVLRSETFDADVGKIAARLKAEIAARRRQQRKGLPAWAAVAMAVAGLAIGLAAGPVTIERLGLVAPLAAEHIRSLEASYAEVNRALGEACATLAQQEANLLKAQADLRAAQSVAEQTAGERDALRARIAQLEDELKKTKSELETTNSVYHSTFEELQALIRKYSPAPCPSSGLWFKRVKPDGTIYCKEEFI
jgi:hypothetical protein